MAKRIHPFVILVAGDGPRGSFFQLWQSERYRRLQLLVLGNRGDRKIVRQYRVADYDDGDELTLDHALRICRDDRYADACRGIPICDRSTYLKLTREANGSNKPGLHVDGDRKRREPTQHMREIARRGIDR